MYKSGSIWDVDTKELALILIAPLIKAKPVSMSLDVWLDECFHVDERHLAVLKTSKAVYLDGITIPKDILIFLRIDDRTGIVELQPDFSDDMLFKLTKDEFRSLVNKSIIGVQH